MSSGQAPASGDGRLRRSQRSRERVVEAVIEALSVPDLELTAERIAAEAGVSLSTLFRHFGDMEGVASAVDQRLRSRVAPILLRGPFEGDTASRVRDLVDRRCQAFEITLPLRRTVLRVPRPSPEQRERDGETRGAMRAQLGQAFAPELAELPAERLAALDALLSFEGYDHLRRHQGLGPREVAPVWEAATLALLRAGP